jgi:nucleotidyltransferase/DNA polymerase involved in DNA repair
MVPPVAEQMLAKMISGLHKPNDQTVLLPSAASQFMAQLPLRAIPGIGHKMDKQLDCLGFRTVADLREVLLNLS